jgi:hypothetical protein
MNRNSQWIEAEQDAGADAFFVEHPLDRFHRWALGGTAAAQLGLMAATFGHTTLMAALMSGYFVTLLLAVCLASLSERGVADEIVASIGAAGSVGYVLVAGHQAAWAAPIWIGVACLAVIVTTDSWIWSTLRAAALFAVCGAMAAQETHHLAFFVWAAAAAIPFALVQRMLVRGSGAPQEEDEDGLALEVVTAE